MGPPERRSVDDVTRTRAVRGSSSQSRPTGLTLIGRYGRIRRDSGLPSGTRDS